MRTIRDAELAQAKKDAQFKRERGRVPVVLCDVEGTVTGSGSTLVDGTYQYSWYLPYGTSTPATVLNRRVPFVAGLPVFIGYAEESTEIEVLGINEDLLKPGISIPKVTAHALSHTNGGFDPLPLERRMFTMLKTTASGSGLKINISPLEYDAPDGSESFYKGVNGYDLVASQPGAGLKRYTLVYLNSETNQIGVVDGTTVVNSPAINAVKPDVPNNGIASAYVLLSDTTSNIVDSDIFEARRVISTNRPDILTTKGDLLGFSTIIDRIPVGTNGYILTVDDTKPFGVDWKQNIVGSTYYLHNDSADIATYEQLRLEPANGTEVIETVAVTSATSPVLIDPYISYPTSGVGVTIIPAGVWQFVIYGKVDSVATGNSQIRCRVYTRTQAGTETEIATLAATTPNLTATVAAYTVNIVHSEIAWVSTNRIVLKFYALTSSVSSRNVSLYYDGAVNYTHVHLPSLGEGEVLYAYPAPGEAKNGLSTYAVIQNAINASTAGDVITIGPGTFTESIAANKAIHLKGASKEKTIINYAGGSGFNITASGFILENLTIKNVSAGAATTIFGIVTNNNCTLRNVIVDCSGVTGTSTTTAGVANGGAYTVTMENVTTITANANATNEYGYYSAHASAVATIINGSISATDYDIFIQSGTVDLQNVELVNGTISNAGTLTGKYVYNGGTYLPVVTSNDVFFGNNLSGINRQLDFWFQSWNYFNPFSGWTWASGGAVFDGAPATIDTTTFRGLTMIGNDNTTEDHFAYKSVTLSGTLDFYVVLSKGVDSFCGIRIDAGVDDDDYLELKLVDSTTYPGQLNMEVRYRNSLGSVSTATKFDPLPPGFYIFRMVYNGAGVSIGFLSKDSPLLIYNNVNSAASWTLSRVGIIFSQRVSASSQDRYGLFYKYKLSGVV